MKVMMTLNHGARRSLRLAGAAVAFALCMGAAAADVAFVPGDYYVLDLTDGTLRQATNVDSPARFADEAYKTTRLVFRKIPAGSFTMQPESGHQQNVALGEYAVAIYELTQGQYAQFAQLIPSLAALPNQGFGVGETKAVHYYTYDNAKGLASAASSLASLSGLGVAVAIPNEAEWERAARAGTDTAWFFGGTAEGIGDHAWCNDGGGAVHEVGSKKSNAWGLHDVYGNVQEWCSDVWWGEWYSGSDNWWDACNNQPGGNPGEDDAPRVQRGGATANVPDACSSSSRSFAYPNVEYSNAGVRLVLRPVGTASSLPTGLDSDVAPVREDPCDDTTVYSAEEPAADSCAPTFTIDRVQQHYPWDGKIDIHYTLSGVDPNRFHALYFTATGGGKLMTVFVKDRGGPSDPTGLKDEALARNGSHCYIWDLLETSTNSTQCASDAALTTLTNVFARGTARVTGRIVDTGAPVKVLPGDYRILDIATGSVTEMTNADPLQFNTEVYKTAKIAFRKVKARPSMRVKNDFYIAVFPLTMAQARALNGGTMPETYHWGWEYNDKGVDVTKPDGTVINVTYAKIEGKKLDEGYPPCKGDYWWQYQKGELFPMNRISYNDVRGVLDNGVDEPTMGNVGTNAEGKASLFLKYKNDHGVVLDLPNGFEWELAARGNTTYVRWFFGDDDVNMGYYAWYWDNSLPYTRIKCLNQVGLRHPNQFGLWDVYGNVWQMCRNYANNFREPEWSANYPSTRELRGGTSYFKSRQASHFRPFPADSSQYPGEEFGGAYNWEGYHFYGYRPILVSHGNAQ